MIDDRVGFTPAEVNYVIAHKEQKIEILARTLKKTKRDVEFLEKQLGIEQEKWASWTEEEIEYLKANYGKADRKKISVQLNRSISSICHKANRLGLSCEPQKVINPSAQNWSKEEEQYLLENKGKTIKQLAKELNRKESSIRAKLTRLGLRKEKHRFWTEKEDGYLEKHIGNKTYKEIGKKLKRTATSCEARARRLGIEGYDREYSVGDIARSFKVNRSNVSNIWIKNNNMPAEKKQKGPWIYYSIAGEEFWEWYEEHKELVPINTYEFGTILPEPESIRRLEREKR